MSLRPEEISAIIRQEIEGYENAVSMDEVGTILEVMELPAFMGWNMPWPVNFWNFPDPLWEWF